MKNRFLYFLAALALSINVVGDFVVYHQNQEAVATGVWANSAHELRHTVSNLEIALLRSKLEQTIKPEWQENLDLLTANSATLNVDRETLKQLSSFSRAEILKNDNDHISELLLNLENSATTLLAKRESQDLQSTAKATQEILYSNFGDIVLVLLFVWFYFGERREAARLQKSLIAINHHVESMNRRLQQAMQDKDAKFRAAVHDLKNPLGSILGMAELMHDEAGNKNSVIEMSDIILKVSESTLTLVHSALESERVVPHDPIDASACLVETCRSLLPVAQKKQQKIELDQPSEILNVLLSPTELNTVLYNLIGNSLKFSKTATSVQVSCTRQDDWCLIEITDHGPGFSEHDLQNLFQPGVSLSAKPTGDEISTGIGLSSVKQTLECAMGDIEIFNNDSGHGACARVWIPLSASSLKAEESTEERALQLSSAS